MDKEPGRGVRGHSGERGAPGRVGRVLMNDSFYTVTSKLLLSVTLHNVNASKVPEKNGLKRRPMATSSGNNHLSPPPATPSVFGVTKRKERVTTTEQN